MFCDSSKVSFTVFSTFEATLVVMENLSECLKLLLALKIFRNDGQISSLVPAEGLTKCTMIERCSKRCWATLRATTIQH